MVSLGRYTSFAELAAHERAGEDYREIVCDRESAVVVLAPHGNGIEPGTSELARAIAGDEFSFYCFEGLKEDDNDRLHITSTHFDAPRCVALVTRARTAVAVHGCQGNTPIVYIGGRHAALKARLMTSLRQATLRVKDAPLRHAGQRPGNICNRGQSGRGVQLELTHGLRSRMFTGLSHEERETRRSVFDTFVEAVRQVLLTL